MDGEATDSVGRVSRVVRDEDVKAPTGTLSDGEAPRDEAVVAADETSQAPGHDHSPVGCREGHDMVRVGTELTLGDHLGHEASLPAVAAEHGGSRRTVGTGEPHHDLVTSPGASHGSSVPGARWVAPSGAVCLGREGAREALWSPRWHPPPARTGEAGLARAPPGWEGRRRTGTGWDGRRQAGRGAVRGWICVRCTNAVCARGAASVTWSFLVTSGSRRRRGVGETAESQRS